MWHSRGIASTAGYYYCLASVALLLAAVGVFGVVSDFVAARRRDLGIRMALGARPTRIAGHVLRSAFACVLWGEAFGVLDGTVATTAIRATLFEVSPVDMTSIVVVVLSL